MSLEKHSKRDWVASALDQWEQERQFQESTRFVPKVLSSVLAASVVVVLVCFALAFQSQRNASMQRPPERPASESVLSEKETLELAQNKVFGLMNGRQPRSRHSVGRLGRGISHLNSRLARKTELGSANGS